MSEAKSLVVWEKSVRLSELFEIRDAYGQEHDENEDSPKHEYAHDLTGRFLGVFREVRA